MLLLSVQERSKGNHFTIESTSENRFMCKIFALRVSFNGEQMKTKS